MCIGESIWGVSVLRLSRLPVGVQGVPCSTGFSTIPRSRSFIGVDSKYAVNHLGLFGIYSTIELLNDVNFVLVKTTKNTLESVFKALVYISNSPTIRSFTLAL